MANIYTSVDQLIGNTPLMRLCNLEKALGLNARLLAKLEFFNPGGSVKDRVAKTMIDEAESRGILTSDSVIIEPTSGNTGIGLACVAASRGYRAIIVMPETMSLERRLLMKAYGAELILTEAEKGMQGAIEKAEELHRNIADSVILGQFDNWSNAQAHLETTGPEIWEQVNGKVDIFIASVGTGGTITGTAKYLKKMNANIQVIAVEPSGSPVLSGGEAGSHGIQGIGAGFIPNILDTTVYDEVMTVSEEESYTEARRFARTEGILVGISSGAALKAAAAVAQRPENARKRIVVLLPDSGDRYLSTALFGGEQV